MNWAIFGLSVSGVMLLAWIVLAFSRRWSLVGLIVSLACLVMAGLNSAAPVRGFVDPDYPGFTMGLLTAKPSIEVTLIAGAIFLSAIAASFIAILTRSGPPLMFVAGFCAAMLLFIGWPWLQGAITDLDRNAIQFGEYLTIPGWLGTILLFVLLVLPYLVGLIWSTRAAAR